jgi:hypothetical protein
MYKMNRNIKGRCIVKNFRCWFVCVFIVAFSMSSILWGQESINTTPSTKPTSRSKETYSQQIFPSGKVPCLSCSVKKHNHAQCFEGAQLHEEDLEIAKIAWKYFQNNYQAATGLVNSNDGYPSTTMWDTGSSMIAMIAAKHFNLITQHEFDQKMMAVLSTLKKMALYQEIAPNKAYSTQTGEMTDYNNKPSKGIGYSALDMARLVSILDILSSMHPKYAISIQQVISRWKLCSIVKNGQMYGAYFDTGKNKSETVQEGRTGYEQYGGKAFVLVGLDPKISKTYNNRYLRSTTIYGVKIPFDARDPKEYVAPNYVVTESYALDAFEFGINLENEKLVRNIYEVQKKRYEKTGIVTAVTEDNIDREPYFLYNTIFSSGVPWNTITDSNATFDEFKSVSTKAAISMAALFPEDTYSQILLETVLTAYDPERGWYSGIFENGAGYNKAITANTNGIILEILLYKVMGPLHLRASQCRNQSRPRYQTKCENG